MGETNGSYQANERPSPGVKEPGNLSRYLTTPLTSKLCGYKQDEPEEEKQPSSASGEVVDRLLFRLQKENLPLHATLSRAREMTHEEDTLRIVFEQSAAFHYRMVESENSFLSLKNRGEGRQGLVLASG